MPYLFFRLISFITYFIIIIVKELLLLLLAKTRSPCYFGESSSRFQKNIYIYPCFCVCVFVCVCVCACVYMYVYLYIYLYIYINFIFISNLRHGTESATKTSCSRRVATIATFSFTYATTCM